MQGEFDPYLRWLGIRDEQRPPNHYRLLGIDLFETDADVIATAADRQMAHVRTFQTGQHSAFSQQILNELAVAKLCLLKPAAKADYDARLRADLESRQPEQAAPVSEELEAADKADSVEVDTAVRLGMDWGEVVAPRSYAASTRRRKRSSARYLPVLAVLALAGAIVAIVAARNSVTSGTAPPKEPSAVVASSDNTPPKSLVGKPKISVAVPKEAPKRSGLGSGDKGQGDETIADDAGPEETSMTPKGAAGEPEPGQTGPLPVQLDPPPLLDPSKAKPADNPAATPRESRTPVPDAAAQKAARQEVRGVFQKEYAQAGTAQEKAALAKTLLGEAGGSKDNPAEPFVLFLEAWDLAIEALDPALANQVANEMARVFAVDALTMKAEAATRMSKLARSPADCERVAEAALGAMDEAVAADRFEAANVLLRAAREAARKTKNRETVVKVTARGKELQGLEKAYEPVKAAVETLAQTPDDPAANLTVGKYQCLTKGQWTLGLPKLAKGDDPSLRDSAQKDLAQPADGPAQAALADQWWNLAQQASGRAKVSLHLRAQEWYTRAAPNLTGLAKRRVEKRLEELAAAVEAGSGRKPKEYLTIPLGSGVTMRFRFIPSGKFMMGEPGVQHEVTLSRPFYLGVTEVTQAEWVAVMGTNPSTVQAPNLPVGRVNWADCQAFVAALQKSQRSTKIRFRLPTEAEWEYACRAGSTTPYFFGNDARALVEYGWYRANSGSRLHPVAQLKPNAWGLYDMVGNVWEWCADYYAPYPATPQVDPVGPTAGTARVTRGGSYFTPATDVRALSSAARSTDYAPATRLETVGFRLACDVLP
ncbi:MAG: formylglycine-generating enzyme family protein [Pirellulales bacterium]